MTYRVIQWATGATGREALRAIIDHPRLELSGLVVHSPDKAGEDAGTLAGLDPIGVPATHEADAADLEGDCVSYMPLPSFRVAGDPRRDEDAIAELLRSGKNVVTTVGYVYPKAYGADVVERLEAACAAGGTSLHGTGLNPGFLSDVLVLTFSGIANKVNRIHVLESSVFDRYPSPEVVIEMMGMGQPPDRFEGSDSVYGRWLTALFGESIHLLADGLGVTLDEITLDMDAVDATEAFTIAAGEIGVGTVAAQRWVWTGVVGGEPWCQLEAVWRAGPQAPVTWAEPGLSVVVEGDVSVRFDAGHRGISNGLRGTAAHAVNAIPHVCDAAPGIRTFLDLPLILGRG